MYAPRDNHLESGLKMHQEAPGSAGPAAAGRWYDQEIQDLLKSMNCACIDKVAELNSAETCALFRLIEIQGQSLDEATRSLGLGQDVAQQMLADVRCEVVDTLVLALAAQPADPTDDRDGSGG
jgi:predicted DNA-binding protein (UPF0251 family)